MIPGPSQILICPHCGREKQIMSLISGNTFGAELWSDSKQIAPMLPEISLVQKCPHCGKYFVRTRQEVKFAKEEYSFEQGILTFQEMKEAFSQISEDGFSDTQEEFRVRLMLLHAYNDYHYRCKDKHSVNPSDFRMFVEQGQWLIQNAITDNVVKAEFYREIGELNNASLCLNEIHTDDVFLIEIAKSIHEKIEAKDTQVFRIR